MKLNLGAVKWASIINYVAGGGLTAVFVLGGPKWTAIGPALIAAAGLLKFFLPAFAVTQDASGNAPAVVNNAGDKVASVVTTTSTDPIVAPTSAPINVNPNGPNWEAAFDPAQQKGPNQ